MNFSPCGTGKYQSMVRQNRPNQLCISARSCKTGKRSKGHPNIFIWPLILTQKMTRQTKSSLNRVTFRRMRCELSSRIVHPKKMCHPNHYSRVPRPIHPCICPLAKASSLQAFSKWMVMISDTLLQPDYSWTQLGSIKNDSNTQTLARSQSVLRLLPSLVRSEPRSFSSAVDFKRPALK